LKHLLLPHVFGALEKNAAAFQNLYNLDGVLINSMLTGKKDKERYDYVLKSLQDARAQWTKSYKSFRKWVEDDCNKFMKDQVYVKNGLIVYDAIEKYVDAHFTRAEKSLLADPWSSYPKLKAILDELFANKNWQTQVHTGLTDLKSVLVELIWRVSYFHWQVGNVLPYLYDCTYVAWGNNTVVSPTTLWTLVTGFATSSRQKQLVTLDYGNDTNFSALQKALIDVGKKQAQEGVASTTLDEHTNIASWIWELEPSVGR